MLNKVTLIGRAGQDCEQRFTPQGKAVANVNIAVDCGYGDNKKTAWIRCTFWDKLAEVANQYISKGKMVYIEGELNPDDNGGPRLFQRNDETFAANYEITVRVLKLLGGKDQTAQQAQQPDDDVPF
jgi:single-strand DNA-binding protein